MLNLLLIFGALAAIGAAIMKFLDDVGLRDPQKQSLQKRFDDWWKVVSSMDRREFALVLAQKLSQTVDNYFGVRLFSKQAFVKCGMVSTCLLVLLLGLTGIQNGRPMGVAPWTEYHETASRLDELWSREQAAPKTEQDKQQQESLKRLLAIVRQYNTTGWTVTYSIASLLALALLNAVLFFSSVVYSRLILREIIASGRVFSTVTLLVANFALVFPAWVLVFLVVTILFTPLLWLLLPAVYLLSSASVYWLLAIVAGGSIVGMAFGSAPLKIITLTGFFPCIFAVVVTALSGIVLFNRNRFHSAATWFLRICVEKGPTKVAAAVLALLAASLAAIVLVIRYWK